MISIKLSENGGAAPEAVPYMPAGVQEICATVNGEAGRRRVRVDEAACGRLQADWFACAATEEGVEVLICGAGVVDGPRGNVARVAGDVALAPVSDADIVVRVVFFLCCACHLHPSLVSELLCEFRANFLPLKHATSMGDLCREPPLFTIRTLEGDEPEWGVPVLIQAEASVVKLLFHSRNGSRKFLVMRFMSVY